MAILLNTEIIENFANSNRWFYEENKLVKQFVFSDFKQALVFVNKVGELAEKIDHHPQILIDYNKVVLTLWTHTVEGVTQKDLDLAQDINNLLDNE